MPCLENTQIHRRTIVRTLTIIHEDLNLIKEYTYILKNYLGLILLYFAGPGGCAV